MPNGLIITGEALQQLNNNIDKSYNELVPRGRGLVANKKLTTTSGRVAGLFDIPVGSSNWRYTTIETLTVDDLVPGRLYRCGATLDKITAGDDYYLEIRARLHLELNDHSLRWKFFITPKTPTMEAFFIPTSVTNTIKLVGGAGKTGGTFWSLDITNNCYLYIEDMGDPKGITL